MHKDGNKEYLNFADKASIASQAIARGIINQIGFTPVQTTLSGQTAGGLFELITRNFLENSFSLLHHLRPGKWFYSTKSSISDFDQYGHLESIGKIVENNSELASALGTDYIITPDIVIARHPVPDKEINRNQIIVSSTDSFPRLTPFRKDNLENPLPILHASISCKWTLRSDRGQNARTEALNLIRNRKGRLPHIVSVTAEPLPTRISSLALGTGDLYCVYHFALPELIKAIEEIKNEDQLDMLMILINGRRLRDISDLPFDLAI